MKLITCLFALCTFCICESASAQKYKVAADTVKLNKEYNALVTEIASLNAKLTEEKSKSADYTSKIESTSKDASSSAQESKEQASTATNGDIKDVRKAMKKAKRANNEANDAKDAVEDKNNNAKKIERLGKKIADKQETLAELDKQRAAIMTASTTAPAM